MKELEEEEKKREEEERKEREDENARLEKELLAQYGEAESDDKSS